MDDTKPMEESGDPPHPLPTQVTSHPPPTKRAESIPVQRSVVDLNNRSPKRPSLAEMISPLERAIPPFISPLSTVDNLVLPNGASFENDVGVYTEAEPPTSVSCSTSTVLPTNANLESTPRSASNYHPEALRPSFSALHSNTSAIVEFDRNHFNCPSTDHPEYSDTEGWATVLSSGHRKNSPLSLSHASKTNARTQRLSADNVLRAPICLQSDRIRQLVLESKAVLATSEKCFVKNLSPDTLSYWRLDTAVSVVDKENCALRDNSVVDLISSKTLNGEVDSLKLDTFHLDYRCSPVLAISPLRPCGDAAALSEPMGTTCTNFIRGNSFVTDVSLTSSLRMSSCEMPILDKQKGNLVSGRLDQANTTPTSSQHVRLNKVSEVPLVDGRGATALTTSSHSLCEHGNLSVAKESASPSSIVSAGTPEKSSESVKHLLSVDNPFAADEATNLTNQYSASCHAQPSDRLNMPPPEPSFKKLKLNGPRLPSSEAKSSSPVGEIALTLIPATSPVSSASDLRLMNQETTHQVSTTTAHQSRVCESRPPTVPSSTPVLRSFPSNRWIFTNLPLTKVRSKLHSVIRQSGRNGFSQSTLEQFRSVLNSPTCPNSQLDADLTDHRHTMNSRSLTGVLLVPPESPSSDAAFHFSPKTHLIDASTMTSPTHVPDVEVSTQCTPVKAQSNSPISPRGLPCANLLSLPTAADDRACSTIPVDHTNVLSRSMHVGGTFMQLDDSRRFKSEMEKRIPDTTVETELHLAESCKAKVSRCWKSLVSAISTSPAFTTGSHFDTRYRLLFTSDALHQYPVELLRAVRHLVTAAHLLECTGDFLKAAGVLSEASDLLSHLSQRMRRVEAKLTKRQLKHQSCVDTTFGMNSETCALHVKRDVAWMHLWYYALGRLHSVVHFRDFRLRQLASQALRTQIEEELSKLGLHLRFIDDVENKSCNDTVILSSISFQRIIHLIHLEKMTLQALAEWDQSEQMATELPQWLPASPVGPIPTQENPSYPSRLIDDRIFGLTACSALYGWQTSTGALLSFMDSIIEVHSLLISRLKSAHDSSQLGPSEQLCSDSTHLDKPISPIREHQISGSRLVTKCKESYKNNSSGHGSTPLKHVYERKSVGRTVAALNKDIPTEQLCLKDKRCKSAKRRLLQSPDNARAAVNTSPPNTAADTESETGLVRYSHDNADVVTEKINCRTSLCTKSRNCADSPQSKSQKSKACSKQSGERIRKTGKLYSHEVSTSLDSTSPDIHSTEMRHNLKVARRSSSKTAAVASDCTPNQNVASSDCHSSLSPASLRMRPRSKSLASVAANRVIRKKAQLLADDKRPDRECELAMDSQFDDRVSQPKRARTAGFISRDSPASFTNSDRSESPVSIHRLSTSSHTPHRRKLRSASVNKGLRLSPASVNGSNRNSTNESIGYSPTKLMTFNDNTIYRNESDRHQSVPVYHVSRIQTSPEQSVNQGDTAFKLSEKSCMDEVSASSSTKNPNRDRVPYFYKRWKNEPLQQNSQSRPTKHTDG
ncbi:unnamed protein product [Dicrocoelium dendriticum]|nr:unnamed protein product [Dicrocoelium dendriticum]